MNNATVYKTYTYWPDCAFKEAPHDGFVYINGNLGATYTYDDYLEAWVDGYGGKVVDFTPKGMPTKAYEINALDAPAINAKSLPKCECGAHFTGNPTFHANWCPEWDKL
jgi:hypothetical protein